MKKLTILFLFILAFSASSHAQWEIQHTNTEYTLRPVFFADANTGFVVGNIRTGSDFKSTLLKTEDTGATWATVLKSDTLRLRDVFFTSTKTGYLIASSVLKHGFAIRA